MGIVEINASSFAEYTAADRRRRTEIVTGQHERATVEDHHGRLFYLPILEAIRAAVGAPTPHPATTAAFPMLRTPANPGIPSPRTPLDDRIGGPGPSAASPRLPAASRSTAAAPPAHLGDAAPPAGHAATPTHAEQPGDAAPSPEAVLAAAVAAAELNGQARAFGEVAAGFLTWWRRAKLTPVPVGATTLHVGELDVAVAPQLATVDRHGHRQVVLFHLKEAVLTRDAANAALRVLEVCMPDLLAGATPLIVDARRSKEYRLPRNLNTPHLDAWLTAEASAYATHWHATS